MARRRKTETQKQYNPFTIISFYNHPNSHLDIAQAVNTTPLRARFALAAALAGFCASTPCNPRGALELRTEGEEESSGA